MNRRFAWSLLALSLAACESAAPPDSPAPVAQKIAPPTVTSAVKAIDWRALSPFLKDALGTWKAQTPLAGESTTAGAVRITTASRDYQWGAQSAHVQIFDSSMNALLADGVRASSKLLRDGSDGFQRPIALGGQPGFEEWTRPTDGKLTLLVGDRYIVEIRGKGVADTAGLKSLGEAMELPRLAALGR